MPSHAICKVSAVPGWPEQSWPLIGREKRNSGCVELASKAGDLNAEIVKLTTRSAWGYVTNSAIVQTIIRIRFLAGIWYIRLYGGISIRY